MKINLSISVSDDLVTRVKTLARQQKRPVSNMAEYLLEQGLSVVAQPAAERAAEGAA